MKGKTNLYRASVFLSAADVTHFGRWTQSRTSASVKRSIIEKVQNSRNIWIKFSLHMTLVVIC